MNGMRNYFALLSILVCLATPTLSQQKGAAVGATPGSAMRATKTATAAPKLETSSLRISCDSVADVMVTDPRGRQLGDDPIARIHHDEIPNAYYEGGGLEDDETGEADDDPAKLLFIPTPLAGDFKVSVFLDKTGTYSCDLLGYDNVGGTSKAELNDVGGKAGQVQRFTVSFSGAAGSKIKVVSGGQ
jgi:hypothetical protein